MHAPADISRFDRFARYYDRFAPTADASALRAGLAIADREIERIIDVGGGTGHAARALDLPERIVVDAAGSMLHEARRHGFECVRADAATLPFADESVDAVVIADALHHIGDQAGALAAGARVLRPGGVVVCREFDRATLLGRLLVAFEGLVGFESSFFTPEELAFAIERTGLDAAIPNRGFGFTVAGVKR